ncbi:SAM-dependent methyltransferase [Kribbella sp. NPDC056951]|uniref:SAM-dependent methyltransferase n=1 Tax=Kribbella sp. NPDC056951 TaxID=3345978 RepID=UPI00363D3E62
MPPTTAQQLQAALTRERYPRSSGYDPAWIVDVPMGPHPLWCVESLMEVMTLEPGMRVLDLGCGAAVSSIFLAREYGVEVWAADLWTDPTDNWERIRTWDVADRVHPIRAEARELPFAHGFFDAVVSIGAYHYFGTEARYLAYLLEFLKPQGAVGFVAPGLAHDPGPTLPPYLAKRWTPDFFTWQTPDWWRNHWQRTELVNIATAEMVPGGWDDWLQWLRACDLVDRGYAPDATMLEVDQGELLGLVRVLAHRR